jgi:hypothetical protein
MLVSYDLERTKEGINDLSAQYGAYVIANLPSLRLHVQIQGPPEQVKIIEDLLRTKYSLE